MDEDCKIARARIKRATRSEYNAVVYEAKLTPMQEEVLRRHILQAETITAISFALYCSERKVKAQLKEAYKAVYQALH